MKNNINKIPEITLTLEERIVESKTRKLTVRDVYKSSNLFGKLRFLWRWYWIKSNTISWLGYLDSPFHFKWKPELSNEISSYHNLDSEKELEELLKKEIKLYEEE